MEKDFKFELRTPLHGRDRTLDANSYRRMSEGGKKGGAAGAGVPKDRGLAESKFDPILDAFLDGSHELVKVTMEGLEGYTLTQQLNNRIWSRQLGEEIKASTINQEIYLEKL